MIEIVPFAAPHLRAVTPAPEDRLTYLTEAQTVAAIRRGAAWTLLDGGQAILIAGVTPLFPGVGEAWALADAAHIGRPILARAVQRRLPDVVAGLGLHRLQAACRADRPDRRRWLEWLGFRAEGLMRRYSAEGDDFIRYALLVDPPFRRIDAPPPCHPS